MAIPKNGTHDCDGSHCWTAKQNKNCLKRRSFWGSNGHERHTDRAGRRVILPFALYVTGTIVPEDEGRGLAFGGTLLFGPREAGGTWLHDCLTRRGQSAGSRPEPLRYLWAVTHRQEEWDWESWIDDKAYWSPPGSMASMLSSSWGWRERLSGIQYQW